MNEVATIHLGRQIFTISVEAYKSLKSYIDAIKKQVGDDDVVNEVELRMAELLAEHGVSTDKVILPADVVYLKEQLGEPKDFGSRDEELPADKPMGGKQLFRDTDNAMLAGVASGLSNYFGIDVLVIRIVFVIFVLAGGWGILLYIVLWLLIPETKTSSDRLKMAGKAVTIDSLKEVVERADVKGAAERANKTLARPINTLFKFVLKVTGLGFIVSGLCGLLGLTAAGTYLLLASNKASEYTVFPVGLNAHLLLYSAFLVTSLFLLFTVLFGLAIFRRKWPIRGWVTGILAGLAFISLAVGGALAANVIPNIHDRYNANAHSTSHVVQPFTSVNFLSDDVGVTYATGPTYSVSFNYFDKPDLSTIKITELNGTLLVDSQNFNNRRHCSGLCLPNSYNLHITITSPNMDQINPDAQMFDKPIPPAQPEAPSIN